MKSQNNSNVNYNLNQYETNLTIFSKKKTLNKSSHSIDLIEKKDNFNALKSDKPLLNNTNNYQAHYHFHNNQMPINKSNNNNTNNNHFIIENNANTSNYYKRIDLMKNQNQNYNNYSNHSNYLNSKIATTSKNKNNAINRQFVLTSF
jgi:hypothetical protein